MKNIIFIGAYDKTDMLLYIAKALTLINKKVILVDTTTLKKSKYIVPTMKTNELKYISSFEGVDVAVGFENFDAIKKYQNEVFGKEEGYDFALFDIDRLIAYKSFGINASDLHYFVTSFDMFSVKKGLQVLSGLSNDVTVNKIYFTKNMLNEEDEYINSLTVNFKLKWNKKNIVYFPFETSDLDAIYINQRTEQIRMKGLSSTYVDSIAYVIEEISKENSGKIKRACKTLME